MKLLHWSNGSRNVFGSHLAPPCGQQWRHKIVLDLSLQHSERSVIFVDATFYQMLSRAHLRCGMCLCITVISYSQFKGHWCGGQSFPDEQASWRENSVSGPWPQREENCRALWITGWELIDQILSVECLQTELTRVKHRWLIFYEHTQNIRTRTMTREHQSTLCTLENTYKTIYNIWQNCFSYCELLCIVWYI